jgi:hypothetical protein
VNAQKTQKKKKADGSRLKLKALRPAGREMRKRVPTSLGRAPAIAIRVHSLN